VGARSIIPPKAGLLIQENIRLCRIFSTFGHWPGYLNMLVKGNEMQFPPMPETASDSEAVAFPLQYAFIVRKPGKSSAYFLR